jgi:membrane protein required for colicin V production
VTTFDLFILSVIALSGLFAWVRGFSRELVTLVAIGGGLLGVYLFGAPFSRLFGEGIVGPLVGLAVLFLIGFLLFSVALELLTARFLGRTPKRWDKIAGAVFGVIRGWFLMGLVYLALTYYFDEGNMPEAIDNALLKGVVTTAAGLLEGLGLEREAQGVESSDPVAG